MEESIDEKSKKWAKLKGGKIAVHTHPDGVKHRHYVYINEKGEVKKHPSDNLNPDNREYHTKQFHLRTQYRSMQNKLADRRISRRAG